MDGEMQMGSFVRPVTTKKPKHHMRWHAVGGLCLLHGLRRGAEIGVSGGRFTSYLCSIMDDMHITAVDMWQVQPEREVSGAETYTDRPIEDLYVSFKEHVEKYFPGRVHIIRKHSVEAAADIEDGSLDFVFIDADHTYEGCLGDIRAWTPKVRRGGIVCGHDFNWPSVMQAVTETGRIEFVAHDNVWVRYIR